MSDILIKVEIYKVYNKYVSDMMVEKKYIFDDKEIKEDEDIDLLDMVRRLKEDGCIVEVNNIRMEHRCCIYIDLYDILEDSVYGGLFRIKEDLFIDSICNFVLGYIKK